MKRGEAQQSLIATNRWWHDPNGWPAHDPELREADGAPFRYTARVLSNLTTGGLYVLRASERAGPGAPVEFDRVLHHRTRTRKEIDFVGRGFGGAGIESKYVDGSWRRDALTFGASP